MVVNVIKWIKIIVKNDEIVDSGLAGGSRDEFTLDKAEKLVY